MKGSTMTDSWHKCLLPERATIKEAIECLNQSGLQIALVVDGEQRLVGTITDGDVRRGLLHGLGIEKPIAAILNREALVAPSGIHLETAMTLMKANRVSQLPRIDSERRVIGLYLWDEMLEATAELDNEFVIMAGGQGVRLRPYTENCPKPLLPVGDKPILQHIIERAASEGFRNFTILIHYLGQMIVDHFGDGSRFGVRIRYINEDTPLGTGGGLSLIEPAPTQAFVVSNGDVLTNVKYRDILRYHVEHGASATMTVRTHEIQNAFGVVHSDGVNITGFEEKPTMTCQVNAGIYALDPTVLSHLKPGSPCDMPPLFGRVIEARGRAIVYPMHEAWLDVGRTGDLEQARREAISR